MIEPLLADDAFLADVQLARADASNLHVWWLGQSGYLLQWKGKHALVDPYLSDSLTKKYAATDKPHVRMTRRVIAPERLEFIDVISASHIHTDHLDPETLQPLFAANQANEELELIVPAPLKDEAARRAACHGNRVQGLADGSAHDRSMFRFHAIPAAHNAIDRDEHGRCMFLGFIIEAGPFRIYHSGDTLPYAGLAETVGPFNVDLALLPINGHLPERRVAGNLSGVEAARLAKAAQAKMVVPCHYEMFEFNTASPDEFVTECQRIDQPHRVLRAGERLTLAR